VDIEVEFSTVFQNNFRILTNFSFF